MDISLLSKKFAQLGARVQLRPTSDNAWRRELPGTDIRSDGKGEYFDRVRARQSLASGSQNNRARRLASRLHEH